ncbi:ABC transporter ATP-binding protein [Lentibacillus cibarius]|uniref:ATP-binding cassette domain-containing protein n=1 Tax=Lentibacillus cibarius TaxID=2583219 RepID=A0A5S3QGE7_9BACI|nr:ABC transporter ATP-binding protein [Lentibacillus cibarius]TMN20918.1 ATP-binding cassette domain-containing protein [Lentibacillus cibarius]
MEQMTRVENLRLKFPGDESLLFKDLSVSFQKGEKVLLLGPSGCGKSTLLQLLSGLIPNSYEVPLKADKLERPSSWGYVFQDPDSQFCMPYVDEEIAFVLENLRIPREKMQKRINRQLKEVSLELQDIHTPIASLSGGMKQRLAIASVLTLNPDVLFLDEPTAMLDPVGTKDIWDVIKNVSENKTVLVVEHKIDHVLEFIDRIILFNENGEIIADGPKDMIFSNYKQEMKRQGIWFPGVWDDYLAEHPVQREVSVNNNNLLRLQQFKGYRNKEIKISVDEQQVSGGEWIVIRGDNGAGKSTFLHALMQFIKTTGKYELMGIPIKKVKNLHEQMTFVFQNPELQFVANSVYEEIAYSLRIDNTDPHLIEQRVAELLHVFRLANHQDKNPFQLSMGQKRRLSVAASIIKEQQIILLDEPTFGQDSRNTFALLEWIEQYRRQGTTFIMVTHDEQISKYFATRIWTVENGKVMKDEQSERQNKTEFKKSSLEAGVVL